MNKTTYIFFGYWSEYVLHPLYTHMQELGYECAEITPDSCENMREAIQKYQGRSVVFVTSAHLFLDASYHLFKNIPGALSALEAMDILSPVKNIYYPHDLACLIHDLDIPWIYSIFDVILSPMECLSHMGVYGSKIINVGWIKKHRILKSGQKHHVIHGFSEEEYYYQTGFDKMYERFKPIWDQDVLVKGGFRFLSDEFEHFLSEKGVHVCNINQSILDLIEKSEIVVTNSLTSVNIESSLSGRYTINLLDGVFPASDHYAEFAGLPNIEFLSVEDGADRLKQYFSGNFTPPAGEDLLKPFDFSLACKYLTE